MSLFEELKRRNVFRVAAAYVIVGWMVLQVGEVLAPALNLPDWVMSFLAFFLLLGFPLSLVLAWAFELTPEGIRRESDARRESEPQRAGRGVDYLIVALLVLVVAYTAYDRPGRGEHPPRGSDEAGTDANDARSNPIEGLPRGPDLAEVASIAVLPFTDLSPGRDQEYFSDGIAEELLNLLVRVDGLKVASRTSSFAYKSETPNIARIAQDLNVTNILEGSVRKSGNRVRITAQLVDARQDRHLWSESFDRDLTDIFAIQEEIANAIVNALRDELGLERIEGAVTVERATRDMSAYDLYLQAQARFINREELDVAVTMAEEAVSKDPGFSRAWELLAALANVAPGWGYVDRDYPGIARAAAETAIELNESRSMAWAVLGSLATGGSDPDYAAGIDFMGRAVVEDPKNASAWLWRGLEYSQLGFFDEAASDIRQCLAVDPAYLLCLYHLGLVESLRGNPQELRDRTEQMLKLGFDHHVDQHVLFLGTQGDHLSARLMARLLPQHPDFPVQAFLDALKFPNEDHSEGVAGTLRWLEQDDRVGASEMLFYSFHAWDRLIHDDGVINHWIWSPLHPDFRQSKDFKRIVHALGLDRYWRERGFPPQCQPLGGDDFDCR